MTRPLLATIALAGAALAAAPASARYAVAVNGTTLEVTGDKKSDSLSLRLQSGVPGMLEIDVKSDGTADFTVDRATFDTIVVSAGAGNDLVRIDGVNGNFTDTESTLIDGGEGDDALHGGAGAETFLAGAGDDFVDGNQQNDTILLGEDDDFYHWDPGDGSDVVEGQDGDDVLDFSASNAAEVIDLAPNGGRLLFFRNVGNIVIDANDVERVVLRALGGADTITVNDLTGTDVTSVAIDLAAGVDPEAGDGQADVVQTTTAAGPQTVAVDFEKGVQTASGLPLDLSVAHADNLLDRLSFVGVGNDRIEVNGTNGEDLMAAAPEVIATRAEFFDRRPNLEVSGSLVLVLNGLGGPDNLSASFMALTVPLELHGGKGNDLITGSAGPDVISGGPGRDSVNAGDGDDVIDLGPGSDFASWVVGDGSETIEGGTGRDRLVAASLDGGDSFALSAIGERLSIGESVGGESLDVDGVEDVRLILNGGADAIAVNDLFTTAVKNVELDLGADDDSSDGAADAIVVNGTALPDKIKLATDALGVVVKRPRTTLRIELTDPALDTLTVNGLAGVDKISGSPQVPAQIVLTINED